MKKENSVCTLKDENIIPYLPYRVKVQWIREDDNAKIISDLTISDYNFLIRTKKAKLILRPFADLMKEIEVNGEKFIPITKTDIDIPFTPDLYFLVAYGDIQKLLEWHLDLDNLIPQGLAIDINTLND